MDEWQMGNRASPNVLYLQAGTAKTGPDPYTIARFSKGEFGWPMCTIMINIWLKLLRILVEQKKC
jgi:hypothetical protein